MTRVKGGARLCGSGRKAGEIYLESSPVMGGRNIERFLYDYPLVIDPAEWGVSPIGVRMFQDEHGVTHVLDWVGESHYPEVGDFIEEAARMGVSRKISHTQALAGLTSNSRLFLMHARAYVSNAAALPAPADFACPCGKGHRASEPCVGWAYHAPGNVPGEVRKRKLVDDVYDVRSPIPQEAQFLPAVFLVVPLTNLTVIRSADGETFEDRLERARKGGLPVLMEDE